MSGKGILGNTRMGIRAWEYVHEWWGTGGVAIIASPWAQAGKRPMGNPVRPHDNCGGLSAWEFSRARAQARACREKAKIAGAQIRIAEQDAKNHLRRLWPGAPWANLVARPTADIEFHTLSIDGNVLGHEQPLM